MTEAWDERERRRAEAAEEYRRKAAECLRHGHEWSLLDAHPDWYDGRTYQCDRCHAAEFRCVDGAEGTLYEDPEHDPGFRAVGHEWLLGPQPAAPLRQSTRRMRALPSAAYQVVRRRARVGVRESRPVPERPRVGDGCRP